MLLCCLMRFIYKKVQNNKMGNNIKIGAGKEENLYKSVMKFMKNSLKKSIPFVMKAIPEIKKRMPFRTH